MTRGRAVQIGSASDLFERPQHTFVGHFIGSPGMNFLPAQRSAAGIDVAGCPVTPAVPLPSHSGALRVGVRPEYITLTEPGAPGAVPASVTQAQDIGTYWLITAQVGQGALATTVRARLNPEAAIPAAGQAVWLLVVGPHTCFYADDLLIDTAPIQTEVSA